MTTLDAIKRMTEKCQGLEIEGDILVTDCLKATGTFDSIKVRLVAETGASVWENKLNGYLKITILLDDKVFWHETYYSDDASEIIDALVALKARVDSLRHKKEMGALGYFTGEAK